VSAAARPVAPVLLFFGVFALVSLAGGMVLRATGVARAVRGPSDRAAGALLGGVKGTLGAWVLLSAFVLAAGHLPAAARAWAEGSDFAAVARTHNLVARLDPEAARRLEKLQGLEDLEHLERLQRERRRLEDVERRRHDALERLERP
jgi:membrane protein required for colicin V production